MKKKKPKTPKNRFYINKIPILIKIYLNYPEKPDSSFKLPRYFKMTISILGIIVGAAIGVLWDFFVKK
jgi:hypothetical protein